MAILNYYEYDKRGLRAFRFNSTSDMNFHLHTNAAIEIQCFFKGSATQYIDGTEYRMMPGDIILVRPGETHYPLVDLSTPYERCGVLFSQELFESITDSPSLLDPFFDRSPGTCNMYHADAFAVDPRHYFTQMTRSVSDQRSNILAYTVLLLQELEQAFRKQSFAQPQKGDSAHRILGYINENLQEDLSIERLCREFYISSAQLSRIVKRTTGLPVGQYITLKRMNLAQSLIAQGNKPTQICTLCGYPNYASFYRAYRAHFGKTPKDFLLETLPR